MHMYLILLLSALFFFSNSVYADMVCSQDPRIMAPCYDVEGRLTIYANMRPRIQLKEGNGKILAIVPKSGLETGEEDYYWPQEIEDELSLEKDIDGRFRVCPFKPPKLDELQYVCIDKIEPAPAKEN